MVRPIAAVFLATVVCVAGANGQNAGSKKVFEVVSIKPSPPPDGRGIRISMRGGPGSNDPGRATFENFSLANLVTLAYGLNNYQLAGADGLDNIRFNIDAKIPDGATRDDYRLMLQNMLAERFKLSVEHQKKEIQTWQLVVAKNGPKLTPSEKDAPPPDAGSRPAPGGDGSPVLPPGPGMAMMQGRARTEVATPPGGPRDGPALGKDGFPVLSPGPGMAMMNGRARMQVTKTTMEQLAGKLAGQLGRPVADTTGLKGEYDFSLYWVTDSMRSGSSPAELDAGPTLLTAVQEQLGLKLEATRGEVDVVVIDHIEKVPTEN